MSKRTQLISVVTLILVPIIVGCRSTDSSTPPSLVPDSRSISIQELASQLGLHVDEQDLTFSVLRGNGDTVLIFTHTGGRFFVNGKPIGPVGKVKTIGGTIYVSSSLVSQIRPHLGTTPPGPEQTQPPVVTPRATIVIDPGHGAHDPGTTSVTGIHEKVINLAVGRKVAKLLQRKGLTVIMTRSGDQYPELEERAVLANRRKADLFVSIHADWAASAGAQGFTVYVAESASTEARLLARAIARAMATTGQKNRGVREENFRVLVKTNMPAVLIELGYVSNPTEARRLQSDEFQNRLATAISTGISDYLYEQARGRK